MSLLQITFLGTTAATPTPSRNVSSLVVQREGELLMFDCGEGTQRQMMRYGTGFALRDIFFTHLHGDHFLGVTGLLSTMALHDRTEPLTLWTPGGTEAVLRQAVSLGGGRWPFDLRICALEPDQAVERDGYRILAFRSDHKGRSLGYALVERSRPGRFDPDAARRLEVPEGPLWGALHRGRPVEAAGRTVRPEEVVGPPRRGRRVVYTGDTRPSRVVEEAAREADLLIHEATFGRDESARARATGHSTAADAARIAAAASVRELVLTHLSARYSESAWLLEEEARSLFDRTRAAYDGLRLQVALPP